MRTVKEVSALTGVTVRTLRYYDRIGLLRPEAVTEAGYRLYGDAALERLRHILLYRELGFSLREIGTMLDAPGYGDLPLDAQGPLLELLSAPKRIGVTLTGAGLLAPVKSITAICGITAQPCRPYAAKCARCTMTNCAYRKE